jgi:hypothetical protein
MTVSQFRNQIQNRNFLSPGGFEFTVTKNRKIDFFCQTANLPQITATPAVQPSYLKDIDVPGEKLEYADLELSFLVDENLENYMAVHNWLTGLGFPKSPKQFTDLITDADGLKDLEEQYSDCTLIVLNSNFKPQFQVKFQSAFPTSLTGLDFDTKLTGEEYFTATATFRYTIYEILDMNGKAL